MSFNQQVSLNEEQKSKANWYDSQQSYCKTKCSRFLNNPTNAWKNERIVEVKTLDGTIRYDVRDENNNTIRSTDENGNNVETRRYYYQGNYNGNGGLFDLRKFLKIFKATKATKATKTTKPTKATKATKAKKPTKATKATKATKTTKATKATKLKRPTKKLKQKI